MAQPDKADIIRSLFDAYRTKTRAVLENLLADDFTFTSPYDDAIDKRTYFERCWPASIEYIRGNRLETICETGNHAFVRYECETVDGKRFRNTEFFTFAGAKVRSIEVYFGATYKDGVFVRQP